MIILPYSGVPRFFFPIPSNLGLILLYYDSYTPVRVYGLINAGRILIYFGIINIGNLYSYESIKRPFSFISFFILFSFSFIIITRL